MKVLYISLSVVLADQLTKLLVKGFSIPFLNINYYGMHPGERIDVIGDFFRLTFIENPGMAFGFDPGSGFKIWISLFSLAASIGLVVYLYYVRHNSRSLKIALAFILGGAVGNLIDRMFYGVFYDYAPLFYGKVVDFLDFDFFDVTVLGRSYERWPIFNLADAAVTVGVLILIIFYKQHQEEDTSPVPADEVPSEIKEEVISAGTESSEENLSEPGREKLQDGEADKGKEIQL